MKVGWVIKSFGLGGAERLLAGIAPRADGVTFVPVAVRSEPTDVVPELRRAGLEPRILGMRSDADPRWIGRLRRLVREEAIALVHVHSPLNAALLRLAGGPGVPTVYTEHNVWEAYRATTRTLNAITWSRAGSVIAVSEEVGASIRRGRGTARGTGPEPVVIPNGVDVAALASIAPTPIASDPVVGTVSNLRPEKGVDVLLDAGAILRARRSDVTIAVVGGGPLERTLRGRVDDPGIVLAGRREDAATLLRGFTIYVQPSRAEGLPLAVLEAMAMGRPIVATAVGGVPGVLEDGVSGLLVPPDDAAALAAAIGRLLDDRELAAALGAAAAARVGSFDVAETARRHVEVYERVLAAAS